METSPPPPNLLPFTPGKWESLSAVAEFSDGAF